MRDATPTGRRPVALVTGASSGIGAALAEVIAADGYDLVLVARRAEALAALAARLPTRAETVTLDLGEPDAGERLEAAMASRGIEIDVLVNNAGYGQVGAFASLDRRDQLGIIDLNVRALTDLTHRFVGPMRARGSGGVINVSSTAAFQPGPLMAVYYASKAYVLSFSEAITEELRKDGVRVTALCPGPTKSEFQARADMEGTRMLSAMPVMTSQEVARIGWRGFKRGKPVVVTGVSNKVTAAVVPFAPRRLLLKVVKTLQCPK
jgi:short-subunit dehydrogenase